MSVFASEEPIIAMFVDATFAGDDGRKFLTAFGVNDIGGDFQTVWTICRRFGASQRFFGEGGCGDVEWFDGRALFQINYEVGFVCDDAADEVSWVGGIEAGVVEGKMLARSVDGDGDDFTGDGGEMKLAERAGFGRLGVATSVAAEENRDVRELDGQAAFEYVGRFDFEFAEIQMRGIGAGGDAAARQGTVVGEGMHEAEEEVIAFGRDVFDAELALGVGGGVEIDCENARAAIGIAEAEFHVRDENAFFFYDAGDGYAFEHGQSVDLAAGGEFGKNGFGVVGRFRGEGGGEKWVFTANGELALGVAFGCGIHVIGVAVTRACRATDRTHSDAGVRNGLAVGVEELSAQFAVG